MRQDRRDNRQKLGGPTSRTALLVLTLLVLVGARAVGNADSAEALILDASRRFGVLRSSEQAVLRAYQEGIQVALSNNDTYTPYDEPIRARFIAWLCTEIAGTALPSPAGLRINGGRVEGLLDLSRLELPFRLEFTETVLEDGLDLTGTSVHALDLSRSRIGFLHANSLLVTGDLNASCIESLGEVWLCGATVHGSVKLDCAILSSFGDPALSADGIAVGGSLRMCNGFHAIGEIRLVGAKVGGEVNCAGGHFENPDGDALSLDFAEIGGSLSMIAGFESIGQVRFPVANILGEVSCSGGSFTAPRGIAIVADGATVRGSIHMGSSFHADGVVSLDGATASLDLDCRGGVFEVPLVGECLRAIRATVRGSINLGAGFSATGRVNLTGTQIGGDLDCNGGSFESRETIALLCTGLDVRGDVLMGHKFRADGQVWLDSCHVAGSLICDGGSFINTRALEGGDGYCCSWDTTYIALQGEFSTFGKHIWLREGFEAVGEVRLLGVRTGSSLECDGGSFRNPDRNALTLWMCDVSGSVLLGEGTEVDGVVTFAEGSVGEALIIRDVRRGSTYQLDLRDLHVDTLADERSGWPAQGGLHLSGLEYEKLSESAARSLQDRLEWLSLTPSRQFDPQPYEQLAGVLHSMGRHNDANRIMIEHARQARANSALSQGEWLWYFVLGPLIGFGYHVWNALIATLMIVLAGAAVFRASHRAGMLVPNSPTGTNARVFNSLFYSLDAFLPLIDLGYERAWTPLGMGLEATGSSEKAMAKRPVGIRNRSRNKKKGRGRRKGETLRGVAVTGARTYCLLHKLLGWILLTLLVAGLSGLVKA
jgi:hypothetical protein